VVDLRGFEIGELLTLRLGQQGVHMKYPCFYATGIVEVTTSGGLERQK